MSARRAVASALEALRQLGRRGSRLGRARRSDGGRRVPTPTAGGTVVVEYTPSLDGDPDPGEVVWTWVSFEDDPTQGKDRPVVILGRRGTHLVGVGLTSKRHDGDLFVGRGPWDSEGRPSYAKVDRLLDIDPANVRREGAVLDRRRFDDIVAAVDRARI